MESLKLTIIPPFKAPLDKGIEAAFLKMADEYAVAFPSEYEAFKAYSEKHGHASALSAYQASEDFNVVLGWSLKIIKESK